MSSTETTHNALGSRRRFELLERIGSGAFGDVYLADMVSGAGFSRTVAVKLLHEDRFDDDDATRRIRDEARLLGKLSHPHIVGVMDLVRLDDQWAVVMEHVEGADLEHVLLALRKAGRTFPATAVLELVSHVADALDAAYNAEANGGRPLRVVHRDIKPANLRLTSNGDVKVLDFGIARARLASREAHTGAYVIGTQRYMAPERIAGHDEGPEGDVYSLGATAFELLMGEPLGRSPVLFDRHEKWVRKRLKELDQVLDAPLDARRRIEGLLYTCLAAEPLDRPRAADLAQRADYLSRGQPGEDLRAFGRRFIPQVTQLLGTKPDKVNRVLTEGSTAPRPVEGPPDTLRSSRAEPDTSEFRRPSMVLPVLMIATVVLLVGGAILTMGLLGGVGAWWVMQSHMEPVDPSESLELDSGEGPIVHPVEPSEPAPRVELTPVEPAPRVAPAPAPAPIAAPVAPTPPKILSRAQIVVREASSVAVKCGGVRAVGTASVRIMSFPAGSCTVSALVQGVELQGHALIVAPRTVTCGPDAGALVCD